MKEYMTSKKWQWDENKNTGVINFNRPMAGLTHQKELPIGKHPIQLYSLATPNGVKITIMLEELLALGYSDAEYDAHLIRISNGEQFGSDFVGINPNSKIPAMLDCSVTPPIRVFESGSILLYLAEKFDIFLPKDARSRTECLNWLFWQVGSAPYVGGGFGHFYKYAPLKIEYCIDRFTMETKRQLDVLNQHLEKSTYMVGETYTIADIAIWPWYGSIVLNDTYEAAEFLNAEEYTHLCRWAKHIEKRIPVKRGRIANKTFGPVEKQLHERHNATDLDKIFDSA